MPNQKRYHYAKKLHRKKRWWVVWVIFILVLAIIAGLIAYDIYRNKNHEVKGATQIISSEGTAGQYQDISDATYKMKLPDDWKEIQRIHSSDENYVTWQSTATLEPNRYMSVYVDILPRGKAVNHMVLLGAAGDTFNVGN